MASVGAHQLSPTAAVRGHQIRGVGHHPAPIPSATARALALALDQPRDVDVNEIVVRPVGQR